MRLKLVHLLQTAGELDTAIKEYEALIKAAPNNPDFVFELCETLIERGDRPKALKLLGELEGRAHEDDVLAAVADFYERFEEKDRSLRVLSEARQPAAPTRRTSSSSAIGITKRATRSGPRDSGAGYKIIAPTRRAPRRPSVRFTSTRHGTRGARALEEAARLDPGNVRYKKALGRRVRTTGGDRERTTGSASTPALWSERCSAAKAGTDKVLAARPEPHRGTVVAGTMSCPTQVATPHPRFSRRSA